jgi:hypothetical protein
VKKELIREVLPEYWEVDEWLVFWVNFYSSFVAIYLTHLKHCESEKETEEDEEFGTIQKERNKKVKLKWEKNRNGEKYWWKMFWKNLVNCFGDGNISKGEEEIYKKAKKTRWKRNVKQKAIRRGYYHKLQKSQVNYCLDLSHLSNEKWKEKWKEEITQRFSGGVGNHLNGL